MPFSQIPSPVIITAPTGQKVFITSKDIEKYTKKAFEVGLIGKINRKDQLKRQIIDASITSVGQAIGFAVGGLLAGFLLSKILGVQPRPSPPIGVPRRGF